MIQAPLIWLLWRSKVQQRGLEGALENGLLVQVRGNISFYEKTGRFKFYLRRYSYWCQK